MKQLTFLIRFYFLEFASFTGVAYFLLERLNVETDERQLEKDALTAIFLSAITFTSHFEFKPQTHPARLLSFSWTLWTLIMASAYTANLASFLVSRHQVNFSVNTLEDALKSNIPVCVQRYSVMDEMMSSRVSVTEVYFCCDFYVIAVDITSTHIHF